MTELLNKWLSWMSANPNLSGWAQAFGVVLAIVIAIATPAWQRWQQTRDARQIEIEIDLVCASSVFFLLNDVESWLQGCVQLGETPRSESRRDFFFHDLIDRIKLLEQREKNLNRVIGLHIARDALLRTQSRLELPFLQSHGAGQKELDFLTADIALVQIEKGVAHWLLDEARLRSDWTPVKFWELQRRFVLLKRG